MSVITSYVLSDIAETDVSDIYDYTCTAHSAKQAVTYLLGLEDSLTTLVAQPRLGKLRPEIRAGLYSYIYEQHVIFYRIMTDHIRIVRVLHGRRDMPTHLKDMQ